MKYRTLDLLNDVTTTYDQTKTTISGRVSNKVIDSLNVLGPAVNKFIDVFSDTSNVISPGQFAITSGQGGRILVADTAPINGSILGTFYDTLRLALYDFNLTTGNHTYVGRLDVLLPNYPAVVHTIRFIKLINDSTNTGWRILIGTTASVAVWGGVFLVNNINKTDFVPIGFPTIPMATTTDQKAVYFLQDPANIGIGNLNTATVAAIFQHSTNRLYVHNGTATTHQYYVYNTNPTSLTIDTRTVNVSVGSPGVVTDPGHTFLDNDPVVFLTGPLPTPLNVGTVYSVRNPTATTYNLAATPSGTPINTTGSPATGVTLVRGLGTTGSAWVHKTGNLPSLTGTLLANDSEDFAIPNHTTLTGQECAFLSTTTRIYMGLLSELTSGATTWPSLIEANTLGAPSEIILQNNAFSGWSNEIDRAILALGQSHFILKRQVSNEITDRFGTFNISQLEGVAASNGVDFGCVSINALDTENGWLGISCSVTGQRGILLKDIRSDFRWDIDSIITKVINVENVNIVGAFLHQKLQDFAVNARLFYRTSGFSTPSGGWVSVPLDESIALPPSTNIQFKILFRTNGRRSTIPQQIRELFIQTLDINEISDKWEYTHDDSNPATNTVAYRLKIAYTSSVPNLRHTVRDLSNTLLANHTTSANPSFFQYSTDGGVNWNNLGTIPNVVGTLVRYTNSSLPNQELRPALTEA